MRAGPVLDAVGLARAGVAGASRVATSTSTTEATIAGGERSSEPGSEERSARQGMRGPHPSQAYQRREIENILGAFNGIKDHLVSGGSPALTVEAIQEFDREVLAGLEQDDVLPGAIPGMRPSVVVGPYRGAPREDCRHLVEQLCEWLNGPDFEPPADEWTVPYALVKAVCAHLYVAWIHPFDDGNGRTARLIELQILLAAGVPMPAGHLLSNHYNATRPEYYRQLQRASASGGDMVPFLHYAIRGFVDGIRTQVARVWEQQIRRQVGAVRRTRPSEGGSSPKRSSGASASSLALSDEIDAVARREIPSARCGPRACVRWHATNAESRSECSRRRLV